MNRTDINITMKYILKKFLYMILRLQIKKTYSNCMSFLAGVEGLEPSQAVLETDVLPLTLYPYKHFIIIQKYL